MTAPVHDQSDTRITQLDALRGLAVIGILWMNVYVYALPAQGYYNPLAWSGSGRGDPAPFDRLVWTASFVFIEDKFRTLFAMLFGAGCVILLEKGGEQVWRAHFARMFVLFVIGLAHATLFANNDILRAYAMTGCALPFIAHLSPKALVAIAVGLIAVHVGGGIIAFGSGLGAYWDGRLNNDLVMRAQYNFGADPAAVQLALDRGREAFGERVARRIAGLPEQLTNISASVPLNLAGMALGIALWKDRMLAAEWRTFRLQRLAAVCAIVAIPVLFLLAGWVSDEGFAGIIAGPTSLIWSAPFDTILGVAYAALAMALFTKGGAISRWLASVGRLSLTNYLLSSVVLAALFASWGLALFGTVSRVEAFALSFVPIALMLIWSPLWTRHLGQGPFERLWRGAARLLS